MEDADGMSAQSAVAFAPMMFVATYNAEYVYDLDNTFSVTTRYGY